MTDNADMDLLRDEEVMAESIYPVICAECDWSGMSDDCVNMRCPYCGERVTQEFDDYRSDEQMEDYKRG